MPDSGIFLQIGPLTIRWYGLIITAAMILALAIAAKRAQKKGLDPDNIINLALVCLPTGVIGARLYFIIFKWSYYSQHLNEIWRIWEGGLAIHGGLIAGIIAMLIYFKVKKESPLAWLDLLAPEVLLAQGIGRWGNYFNKEAYGYETDVPWAIYVDGAYHHPTFFYEFAWNIIGFFILIWLDKKKKLKQGQIFALYLVFYSIGRFFIESMRTDNLMLGSLRVAMLFSAFLFVLGIILFIFFQKYNSVKKKN